jgi:hypothetical protein
MSGAGSTVVGFEQRGAACRIAQPRCSNETTAEPRPSAYLENSLGLACAARRFLAPVDVKLLLPLRDIGQNRELWRKLGDGMKKAA